MATISVKFSDREAECFAQFVKRAGCIDIGPAGADLATWADVAATDFALIKVRDALVKAGYSPR